MNGASPVAQIASPKMIRGLSITKKEAGSGSTLDENDPSMKSFDIRIKNHK